uniref:protein-histidine N-methyltransferase n=1 Tax=Piliocolobus tephrosceles TaxID=591936 RepID=A0A8C9GQH9_9PRIM
MYEVYYLNKDEQFEKAKENDHIESQLILKNRCVHVNKKKKVVKKDVYEGGFVIWECTWDMLKFLHKEKIDFKNKNILELGCAHGLVGIKALLDKGEVVFQEFNKNVINNLLIPNLNKNLDLDIQKMNEKSCMEIKNEQVSFTIVNKPWDKLNKKLKSKKMKPFDFILGNEILYRKEQYYNILKILKKNLKKSGKAYIGTKSYYFGFEEGTGTNFFLDYVNNNEKFNFTAKVIQSNRDKCVYSKKIKEM